jgi:hypothetical protein
VNAFRVGHASDNAAARERLIAICEASCFR